MGRSGPTRTNFVNDTVHQRRDIVQYATDAECPRCGHRFAGRHQPVCVALDVISNTLSTQIDSSKKSTLDSMTKTSTEMVDRTMDAMNVPALNPREMMDTTADVMRKTTDSVADIVRRATTSSHAAHTSGEPESAADALGGRRNSQSAPWWGLGLPHHCY